MSGTKRTDQVMQRTREVAAQLKPVAAQVKPLAAQVKPLARNTGAAATEQVRKTRAWAAPQIAHTSQVLEDSVAPKVSAMLSSAARRLEPSKPRRKGRLAAIGITTLTAAASVVAVIFRIRKKPDTTA
jgi:hypothetical protein